MGFFKGVFNIWFYCNYSTKFYLSIKGNEKKKLKTMNKFIRFIFQQKKTFSYVLILFWVLEDD